jgi:hypothetical protein
LAEPISHHKAHRRGFLSGSLAIGSESAQPTSYHATPRGLTPGVARFLAFCRESSPPWPTISASWQAQRERSQPHPKDRLFGRYCSRIPSQNLLLSISTRDTELTHNTDAEGIAENGEHSRFVRADEPADGTRWNQMELFTTVLCYSLVNKSIEIDVHFVGYYIFLQAPSMRPRSLSQRTSKQEETKQSVSLPKKPSRCVSGRLSNETAVKPDGRRACSTRIAPLTCRPHGGARGIYYLGK